MAPIPDAPAGETAPILPGTRVHLDPAATRYVGTLLAGGAPWQLLRLSTAAAATVDGWVRGELVAAGEGELARTLVDRGMVLVDPDPTVDLRRVSVVVPVRDDVEGLDHLLYDLEGLRVTVVDDGSLRGDEIDRVAVAHGARVVRLASSAGPGAARNAGLRLAGSEFVWFCDADVRVPRAGATVRRLLSHFHDPRVAAAAPRVVGADGLHLRDRFERRYSPLDMGATPALVAPLSRVSYVPTASLMVRRSALGDGFDETLRTGEDVDLVWRLGDRGWLVRYDPTIEVRHRARGDWASWVRQRVGYGRSAAALARVHGDRLAPVRTDGWTLATWVLLVTGRTRWAALVSTTAQRSLAAQLPPSVGDVDDVAGKIAFGGIVRSGGPLARSVVRAYGPLLLILAVRSRRLRRLAVVTFIVGTLWRLRESPRTVAEDLPLAVADDAAYAAGLWQGAVRTGSWRAVAPKVTLSTTGLRTALRADPLSLLPWRSRA